MLRQGRGKGRSPIHGEDRARSRSFDKSSVGRSSIFSRRVEPAVVRILIGPGRARGRSCDRVAAEGGRRSRLPRCALDHSYARPHFFRNISGGLSSRRGDPPFWSGQVEPAVVYATGSQQRGGSQVEAPSPWSRPQLCSASFFPRYIWGIELQAAHRAGHRRPSVASI